MKKIPHSDRTLEIQFDGKLDTAKCALIEDELRSLISETSETLIFNLANVDFVSSSFLRLCLAAFKKVKKGQFHITQVNPMVKKVFKIAGMEEMLESC